MPNEVAPLNTTGEAASTNDTLRRHRDCYLPILLEWDNIQGAVPTMVGMVERRSLKVGRVADMHIRKVPIYVYPARLTQSRDNLLYI